jgi:hypothetical protein
MTWTWSERHIDEVHRQGYTVFAGILPPALLTDLRRATDQARQVARAASGQQAQRLQPVFGHDIEHRPFLDFAELPALVDAMQRTLSPAHTYGHRDGLGVLLEPAELPWCTPWHRDWRDNVAGLDIDTWQADSRDTDLFNQLNGALYDDGATWVVPGSHLRRDLPAEAARFPERPIRVPDLDGLDAAARERTCRQYCESMPGARQLHLAAGDVCLYRNTLWHIGSYIPWHRRATLHDFVDTPAYRQWRDRESTAAARRRDAGQGMANPNPGPAGAA